MRHSYLAGYSYLAGGLYNTGGSKTRISAYFCKFVQNLQTLAYFCISLQNSATRCKTQQDYASFCQNQVIFTKPAYLMLVPHAAKPKIERMQGKRAFFSNE